MEFNIGIWRFGGDISKYVTICEKIMKLEYHIKIIKEETEDWGFAVVSATVP